MSVNEARVEELVGQLAGHMTGGAVCLGMWLGDELGFYRVLAGAGALTAADVAKQADTNPRLTCEWLDSQAAAGFLAFDDATDTYTLSDEAAMILANDESPAFMARGMNTLMAMFIDADKLLDAYRGDGGFSWRDHHECLFRGTEWFFRPGYRSYLTTVWIPALDGVEENSDRAPRSPTSVVDTGRQRS